MSKRTFKEAILDNNMADIKAAANRIIEYATEVKNSASNMPDEITIAAIHRNTEEIEVLVSERKEINKLSNEQIKKSIFGGDQ